jgi:hypothetical protein
MSVRLQVWLIVGSVVTAVFMSNPYAFIPGQGNPTRTAPKPDFLAFYSAGTLLRESPGKLYDENSQAMIQSAALGERVSKDSAGFMPFAYPAVVALLFVPLSLLPYSAAFVTMLALNVLLFGLALDLLCRRFQLGPENSRLLVLCSVLSIPAILTLANGQISFLVFILLILLVGDIQESRQRAGVWAGLLAIKPTMMPVFLFWFLIRRQRKELAFSTLIGAVVLVTSLLVVGPGALSDFEHVAMKMAGDQYATANATLMPNIVGLTHFFGYGPLVSIVLAVPALALLFTLRRAPPAAACGLLILAAVLLASHIHAQDLNCLWIVGATFMKEPEVSRFFQWGAISGSLLTTLLVFDLASRHSNVPFLSILVLLLFLAAALRSRMSLVSA